MPRKLTQEEFVQRVKIVHKNFYDYSKTFYTHSSSKVEIICPTHGSFLQIAKYHINRNAGCPKCGKIINQIANNKRLKTVEQFVQDAERIHHEKYDYSLVQYKTTHTKVEIQCSKHGSFWQTPNRHLSSQQGCPKCSRSKGEEQIEELLKELKISYQAQYKFEDCKYKRKLAFDFYLPTYNLCIEYDGQQHFRPSFHKWPKEKADTIYALIVEKDKIKTDYCKNNNISLLRIPYTELNSIKVLIINYLT